MSNKNVNKIPSDFNFTVAPVIGLGTHTVTFDGNIEFKTDKNGKAYMTITVTDTASPATRTLVAYPAALHIWLQQIMNQLGNRAQTWATPVAMLQFLHTEQIQLTMNIGTVAKEMTDANGNTVVKNYTNIDFKKEDK